MDNLSPPQQSETRSISPNSITRSDKIRNALQERHAARKERRKEIWTGLTCFGSYCADRWKNGWLGEDIAAVLSIVVTLALALVLHNYHGKPLVQWRARITVNTFIAIFSTIIRMTMAWIIEQTLGQQKWHHFSQSKSDLPLYHLQVFEEACRGEPMGTIRMLRTHPSRLAVFGSILAVLTMTIDPFSQELVTYPSRVQDTTGQILSRVQHYDVLPNNQPGLPQLGDGLLQRAVLSVLAQDPMQVRTQCHSGNCETDHFGSIAFCSTCQSGLGEKKGQTLISPSNVTWKINENPFSKINFVFSDQPDIANVSNPIFGFARPTVDVLDYAKLSGNVEFLECALSFCVKDYRLNMTQGSPHLNSFGHVLLRSDNAMTTSNFTNPYFANYSVSPRSVNDTTQYFRDTLTSASDLRIALTKSNTSSAMMDDLASAMSNALLRESGPTSLPVYGSIYTTETIIHVRWPWLLLPVALVIATFVMLRLIAHNSSLHGEDFPLWKSSILALLFHKVEKGLDLEAQGEQNRGGGEIPQGRHDSRTNTGNTTSTSTSQYESDSVRWLGTKEQIENMAQDTTANLVKEENRWIFKMNSMGVNLDRNRSRRSITQVRHYANDVQMKKLKDIGKRIRGSKDGDSTV